MSQAATGAPEASSPGGEGPVLETALVGPAAVGWRGALEALRFYQANPEARARPERLDRAVWGAAVTLQAARLVWTDRALFRAALWPTGLTVLGCALLAGIATTASEAKHPGATFNAFLVSFVALSSAPPTVLQRLWIRVANQARRAVGLGEGEDPFPGESFWRMLWREGWKGARQALVVSVGLAPLLLLASALPFGKLDSALLGGAWGFYWIVVDAFELPLEVVPGPRHAAGAPWYGRFLVRFGEVSRWLRFFRWFGRLLTRLTTPWHGEVRFTERHAWETAGFGAVVTVLLAVPVAGLFLRAVSITAATALLGRLGEPVDVATSPDLPGPTSPGSPGSARSSEACPSAPAG